LRSRNRRVGVRVGNAAPEGLMVHVRLAASARKREKVSTRRN
jgi:hypothetical protein